MKHTLYFLALLLSLSFLACGGVETQEADAAETTTETVTESEPEVTEEPAAEETPEADYSAGYANFIPPTHGDLLPREQWAEALQGHWLMYGFEIEGEMNPMLEIMQNVDTYNADGSWESLVIMPIMENSVEKGGGSWRLEGDKLIINEEDPDIIVEVSDNHFGYNIPGGDVVEGIDLSKVVYYKYRVPAPTIE